MDSFNYALEGLVHTLKTQRNMKIHFALASLALIIGLFLGISRIELILLFLSIVFVIAMELINTSVEVVVNMISEQYSYQARIAKNIAAGAVFMAAINAIIVGYLIFFDRLFSFSLTMINHIQREPSHLTFINIALLLILVVTLKAWAGRGTPLEGGMPSGHSAVAFSLVTIITFITGNILVGTLGLLLAFLVVQSRIQSGTHNIMEVFIGGLLGVLLSLIIFQLL